ncbi:MAG: oxidoreductase [Sphingomonas bacterium]|nr:oxidoreductase [Sphingomonas bacterium]MDB5682796.1 oxidoreductase [Sphingomonas bacterium]
MIIDHKGRIAIVTGSSEGIGFACARALAEAGAAVVINGRSDASVARALAQLRDELPGCEAIGVAADLSSAEGPARIIAAAPSCDILISNCAVNNLANVLDEPDEMFFRLFEINFLAGVRLARHYLPQMIARNRGRVLFHNSEQALRPSPHMAAYGASKAAELVLARSLAEYTRGTAVTVNTIVIGPTRSAVTGALHAQMAEQQGKTVAEVEADFITHVRPNSLIHRIADASEVASMAVYLTSDHASATNGAVLSVEGGTREVIF